MGPMRPTEGSSLAVNRNGETCWLYARFGSVHSDWKKSLKAQGGKAAPLRGVDLGGVRFAPGRLSKDGYTDISESTFAGS